MHNVMTGQSTLD